MLERLKQITSAQWIFLASIAIVVFIIYNIVLAITRVGEIKTEVNVIPKDAKVTINSKPASAGAVYLSAGEYTFSAAAEGWKTDTQKIKISKDQHEVYLLPEPESDTVKNWLKNNPDIQMEREAFGGKNADAQSAKISENNPILDVLPNHDPTGPYDIDYGPSPDRKDGVFITISYSTALGRQKAITWLKEQGVDPTDLEIRYLNFANPIIKSRISDER